jgi:hypothetical protein
MTTTAVVVIIICICVIIAAAGVGFVFWRRQRSRRLRSRFGPEYDRTVAEFGSRPKAEGVLLERQHRMQKVPIHSLSPQQRDSFAGQWHDVQKQFVDDPGASIDKADRLVYEVMLARGYPMADFEHRAEDLSVDHPQVVLNYRAAHAVARRHQDGQAATEEMRMALVYYRDLFDELLEARMAGPREVKR